MQGICACDADLLAMGGCGCAHNSNSWSDAEPKCGSTLLGACNLPVEAQLVEVLLRLHK